MRLSDLLSKAPDPTPMQVEGFLDGRRLSWGKHKRIKVGRIFHNFYCRQCEDQRTFESGDELSCLGLGDLAISIDATLRCGACQASVEVWFLLRSVGDMVDRAPTVQVERYTENLRDCADRVGSTPGRFADWLSRAQMAYEAGLGAGSMIYLRKIFESVTFEVARIVSVPTVDAKTGYRRSFRKVLKDVNEQRSIIPRQFSANGYRLFSQLSEVIHGNSTEEDALVKFKPCLQLVLGVVEEVNRDNVFAMAIDELGWNVDNIDEIAGERVVS